MFLASAWDVADFWFLSIEAVEIHVLKIRTFWAVYIGLMAFVCTLQVALRFMEILDATLFVVLNLFSIAVAFGFPMIHLAQQVLAGWEDTDIQEPGQQAVSVSPVPRPIIEIFPKVTGKQ